MPHDSTTAAMARAAPKRFTIQRAMASAAPLSAITLPKMAPSKKTGKNWVRYLPRLCMKTWV